MWSCHLPRFHPSDFRMRTLDGVGDDWPLSYDDLAPYYAPSNEARMGVAGLSGDPAYPPLPARQTAAGPARGGLRKRVTAAFDRLGWAWWPADIAIASRPHAGRGACKQLRPGELMCPAAREGVCRPRLCRAAAAALGARIVTGATVEEIPLGADGRAEGRRSGGTAGEPPSPSARAA